MSDLGNSNYSETDASNNATPPNGFPEGMNPSDVNNSARAVMGSLKRWWDRSNAVKTSGGSSTAFTLTYDVAAGALYDGEVHVFVADRACVASATLNANSLGAKSVVKWSSATSAWVAVANNDWLASQIVAVAYDLSNTRWKLLYVSSTWTDFISLAGSNAFTGNNSFAGTSTFTGGITATSGTNNIALATGSSGNTETQAANSTKVATTAYVDRVAVQQVVSTLSTAVASGTTTIPFDNTIPQNTEGDQYMSLAITPKSATSKLIITVNFAFSHSAASNVVVALFQDSTANALAAIVQNTVTTDAPQIATISYAMSSGTTLSTTFKVRAGGQPASGGTLYFNGTSGGQLFGGVMNSGITITEVGI